MKKTFFIGLLGFLSFTSCDKVENPFPPTFTTELDYSLYPGGDSIEYSATEWPVFSPNTNSLRNIMLEDFTGHTCVSCPIAADTAPKIHEDYLERVFISTIHSGPSGAGAFQLTTASFPIDWTNPSGLAIGEYFGSIPGSAFVGNPRGSVSRILNGGQHTANVNDWRGLTETAMGSSLKVNSQAAVNYYPSTRGVFIHTEVENLAGLTNDLYTVVTLIEDSVIAKQKMPDNTIDESYIHRDIMRGTILSTWKGRQLTENELDNGKYYFNYSYALPPQYDLDNVHLLIYVMDGETEEVYQVIKKKLQ